MYTVFPPINLDNLQSTAKLNVVWVLPLHTTHGLAACGSPRQWVALSDIFEIATGHFDRRKHISAITWPLAAVSFVVDISSD